MASQAKAAPKQASATVLIVDDEWPVRELVRTALKALPLRLLEASNGVEAMDLVEKEKPDLVITDYQMPLWNGLEVCRSVHVAPALWHIRTVLITGCMLPDELEALTKDGVVDGAMAKPFSTLEMSKLIQRLLKEGPRPPRRSARTPLKEKTAGAVDENFYLALPRGAWEMPCAFCGDFVRKSQQGIKIENAEPFSKVPRLDFLRVWHDACHKQYLKIKKS